VPHRVGRNARVRAPSSDIDGFVVLARRLRADELARLRKLHRELPRSAPHAGKLELEYVALDQLRPWGIEGEVISVSPGEGIRVGSSTAAADDIMGVREIGVSVVGPPPKEVFPDVDQETFVQSQKEWLDDLLTRDLLRSEATDEEYAEWTLNIARCLYGIAHVHGCTKPEAAAWLAANVPELSRFLDAAVAARKGDPVATEVKAGFRDFARIVRGFLPYIVGSDSQAPHIRE
jgi:Aminoglycoside adenylyltransferase, C-terminal domain